MTASEVIVTAAMAAAAGVVGSFVVVRRMALASDALSHVALPGVALAILLHVDPLIGGVIALMTGVVLVWAIEQRTRLPVEAATGVIFSTALAAGSMLASGDELLEALFGVARAPQRIETIASLIAAILVIVAIVGLRSRLVLTLVSPDLARSAGIHVARVDLAFLLAFAVTVALGLRYLGVLLMGSLIIIPAATALYIAVSLRSLQMTSVAIAVTAAVTGLLLAPKLHVNPGALTIVIAATFFVAALVRRPTERGRQ
jgi:ABC-type Mn2+/Zn2+ transport system permease subunit